MSRQTQVHSHAGGQLILILKGLFLIETEETTWYLPPGSFGWIPSFKKHGAISVQEKSPPFVHLPNSLSEKLPSICCVFRASVLSIELFKKINHWGVFDFYDEKNCKEKKYFRAVEVLVDEVEELKPEKFFIHMPKTERLKKMALSILEQPNTKTTLEEWEKNLKMSVRSITRHFKEETGLSVVAWKHQVRLLKSMELLVQGRGVADVAFELGYESVSAFITLFKKHFHVTPGGYLKSCVD